jgi:hypothetical protein
VDYGYQPIYRLLSICYASKLRVLDSSYHGILSAHGGADQPPLLLVFFTVPALAETLPDKQTLLRHWALVFSEDDRQPSRQGGNLPSDLFHPTFTTTVFTLTALSPRLRDMASDIDRPRTQGIPIATRWLKGTFTTEAEVAHNAGWEIGLFGTPSGDTRDDFSNRMVRFSLTAESGTFRYGLTSRTAGKAFLNAPDQVSRSDSWEPTLSSVAA